jgi:FixJ family two-component response regulator
MNTATGSTGECGDRGHQPTVIVVDDDEEMRSALAGLFDSVGLDVLLFQSAAELFRAKLPDAPSCLLLDMRLPGTTGLHIQKELATRGIALPIVFMTGYGDIPMTVQAMKAGAVDFLGKPFRELDMLMAVNAALALDKKRRDFRRSISHLRDRHNSLTPRESEVMWYVTCGLLSKEIAFELGVAEPTIKVHRSNLMRKMGANTVADLVVMAQKLDIPRPR